MLRKRYFAISGIAVVASAGLVAGVALTTMQGSAASPPGTLDDGSDLLPQARISVSDAVAAATASSSGDVGEVDLEYWHGTLVFNVDVGSNDVKVDASTGAVPGAESDD